MSKSLPRPSSPGGIVMQPTVILLDPQECVVAKRDGEFKCVRGDHDHVGGAA